MHGPLKDMAAPEHQKSDETNNEHRYAQVAVRDAFDVARRRLQDFVRRQRGSVKTHGRPAEDARSGAEETE